MTPRRRVMYGAGLTFIIVIGGIQLVPVERSNPAVRSDVGAPAEVDAVLRRACYDCHSNETRWPWYSHVAPASWFMTDHVEHARGDLNFSEWPAFDLVAQDLAFQDIEEQIRKDEMPLSSYTLIHRNARLSVRDREILLEWARSRGLP